VYTKAMKLTGEKWPKSWKRPKTRGRGARTRKNKDPMLR
jgi:hypothetical protein